MEPYVLVIACLTGGLVVWGLLRAGAKRPTAGWAWILVLLIAAVVVIDFASMRATGPNAKGPVPAVARQKAE